MGGFLFINSGNLHQNCSLVSWCGSGLQCIHGVCVVSNGAYGQQCNLTHWCSWGLSSQEGVCEDNMMNQMNEASLMKDEANVNLFSRQEGQNGGDYSSSLGIGFLVMSQKLRTNSKNPDAYNELERTELVR